MEQELRLDILNQLLISKRKFYIHFVMQSLHFTQQMSECYLNYCTVCEKNLIQTRNLARQQFGGIFFFRISVVTPHLTSKQPSGFGFTFLSISISVFFYSVHFSSFYLSYKFCFLLAFHHSQEDSQHSCSLIVIYVFLRVKILSMS